MKETQRNIEGCPAPALKAEQARCGMGDCFGTPGQVDAANAGSKNRLVSITQRGVGDRKRILVAKC